MSFFERRPPNVWVKAQTTARMMEVARAPIIARLDDDSAFAARFYRALGMSLSYRLRRASLKDGEPRRKLSGVAEPGGRSLSAPDHIIRTLGSAARGDALKSFLSELCFDRRIQTERGRRRHGAVAKIGLLTRPRRRTARLVSPPMNDPTERGA
jgi:hypothetical protein